MADQSSSATQLSTYAVNRSEFIVTSTYNIIEAAGFAAFGDEVRAVINSGDSAKQRTAAENQALSHNEQHFIIRKFSGITKDPHAMRSLVRTLGLHVAIPPSVPGILPVVDAYIPAHSNTDCYVVVPAMECTLAEAIYSRTKMDLDQVIAIGNAVANTLYELHSNKIVLGSVYPEAVSIDTSLSSKSSVAMNSLSAAHGSQESMRNFPGSVKGGAVGEVPLCYRAPEWALEGADRVTAASDMWSLGLLLAEMVIQKPLFSGKTPREYADSITNVLGTRENFAFYTNNNTTNLLKSLGSKQPISLAVAIPGCDRRLLMLLQKMLVIDPSKRITAEELLKTPLFAPHNPDKLPQPEAISSEWQVPAPSSVSSTKAAEDLQQLVAQLEDLVQIV